MVGEVRQWDFGAYERGLTVSLLALASLTFGLLLSLRSVATGQTGGGDTADKGYQSRLTQTDYNFSELQALPLIAAPSSQAPPQTTQTTPTTSKDRQTANAKSEKDDLIKILPSKLL